jgi:hypothetical protein
VNGQLAGQALSALETRAVHVGESEVAGFETQHGHIGRSAHGEVAEFLAMDFAGRIPG